MQSPNPVIIGLAVLNDLINSGTTVRHNLLDISAGVLGNLPDNRRTVRPDLLDISHIVLGNLPDNRRTVRPGLLDISHIVLGDLPGSVCTRFLGARIPHNAGRIELRCGCHVPAIRGSALRSLPNAGSTALNGSGALLHRERARRASEWTSLSGPRALISTGRTRRIQFVDLRSATVGGEV